MAQAILLISETKGGLSPLTDVLGQANYPLHTQDSVEQALEELPKIKPDLVLLDARAGEDLETVVQLFRSHPEFSKSHLGIIAEQQYVEAYNMADGVDFACLVSGDPLDVLDRVEDTIGLPEAPAEGAAGGPGGGTQELEDKLYGMRRENRKLVEEKEEAIASLKEHYQPKITRLAELEEEISLLKSELGGGQKERDKMEGAINKLRTEKRELEKELERDKKEKNNLQKERDKAVTGAADKEETHHKAIEALREFYRPKVEKLEKVMEEVKQAQSQAKKLKSLAREKEREIIRLEDRLEKSQKQLEDVREVTNKLKGLLKSSDETKA